VGTPLVEHGRIALVSVVRGGGYANLRVFAQDRVLLPGLHARVPRFAWLSFNLHLPGESGLSKGFRHWATPTLTHATPVPGPHLVSLRVGIRVRSSGTVLMRTRRTAGDTRRTRGRPASRSPPISPLADIHPAPRHSLRLMLREGLPDTGRVLSCPTQRREPRLLLRAPCRGAARRPRRNTRRVAGADPSGP